MGGDVAGVGGPLSTLGSCWGIVLTLGVEVGMITLGAGSGADGGVALVGVSSRCWMVEKMAQRLLMARS
jgi:hypothetical protein